MQKEKKTVAPKEKQEKKTDNSVHLIIFQLGEEEYAVKIEQVKEVTLTPAIYKMPKTPNFIKGVANIRGDIIAIMDLEERFGIKKPKPIALSQHAGYTLVVETENYSIGFIVQKVPETLALLSSQISKTPEFLNLSKINREFIDGIGKVGDRLIIILDIFKVLAINEVQQLSEFENNV